jgi:RES domain-containing protein
MRVYRITAAKYASKLSSSGAANRWNQEGEFVIYSAESRSLASLELVVHRSAIKPRLKYKVLVIDIDVPKAQVQKVKEIEMPKNWRSVNAYNVLQHIGSSWYTECKKLVFQIPSVIIPQEYNYIINTKHKLFDDKVNIVNKEDYFWDARLL